MALRKSVVAVVLSLLLFVTGCGSNVFDSLADKNSSTAKREEAQQAIDSGDYNKAVEILSALCPDNQCSNADDAQQLASAYMGSTGFDLLDFLEQADSLSASGGSGSDFSTISSLFSSLSEENLTSMNNAIAVLGNISSSDYTEDIYLQLGVAQVVGSVIAIGVAAGGYDSSTGTPTSCGSDGCSASEASSMLTYTLSDGTSVGGYVASNLSSGLSNINQTSLTNTDTTNQMNDLVYNIQSSTSTSCSNRNTGSDVTSTTVTSTQIENYLTSCL